MREIGGEPMPKLKRLINRLITWLRAKGLSDEDIADCVSYITE